MPIIALSILIQIACAVHCVRNHRNGMWLMVIIFLSIPGCLAYAIFEILPAYTGHRVVRRAKAQAAKALDPDRDLRLAREALDTADTAAARTRLGDELADRGKWPEAIEQYEVAAAKAPAPERATTFKLARANFEAGRYERARMLIEALPPSLSQSETDRTSLLLARLLDETGETEEALSLYADVGSRLPGGEAQCRQAALLLKVGRRTEAEAALAEVERRTRRLDREERVRHADMYAWAARMLAELRSGQVGA
jgi:hypothetical protein